MRGAGSADDIQRFGCDGGGHGCRAAEVVALQQVHAQVDDLAQLDLFLDALGEDLHTAGVGVGHDVRDDLLLVEILLDAADDGEVDLDVLGRQFQQIELVAVAGAVVIQREGTGEAPECSASAPDMRGPGLPVR